MDGLHVADMLALLCLGLLLFGPTRLPQLGASLGSALREVRKALRVDSTPVSESAQDDALIPSDAQRTNAQGEPQGETQEAHPPRHAEARHVSAPFGITHEHTGPPERAGAQ